MRETVRGPSPWDPAVLAIFDAMPQAVWLARPDGRIGFANAKALAFVGASPSEALEDGWQQLLHPDDLDRVLGLVAHTLATGEPYDVELRMRSLADGTYRWFRSTATALRRDGEIVAYLGSLIDIDTYRAAELQARAAESRLRGLIDSPLIGFLRFERDGRRIIECNLAFASMLGYAPEELVHRSLDDFTPDDWIAESHRRHDAALDDGVTGPFFKHYCRRDGSRVPVFVVGAREQDSTAVVSYVLDVSKEREYATALEEEQHTRQRLLDSLPIVFWTANQDGKPDHFNRWFYEYTGRTPEDILAGGYRDVVHPDDGGAMADRWAERRGNPRSEDRLTRFRRASDGMYRWHRVYSQPVQDENGKVTSWFGFYIDVHERQRADERQQFLMQAIRALSSVVDTQGLADRIVRQCVPAMADSAVLFLARDGELEFAAVAAVSVEREAVIRRFHAVYGPGPKSSPIRTAFDECKSVLIAQYDFDSISQGLDEDLKVALRGLNTRSTIVTPLSTDSGAIGVLLTNYGPSDRRYDESDVRTMEILGERVSVIIENARRFAREHRVAEALQIASLPQALPYSPRLSLSAYYESARSDMHIGGDWYDGMRLSDGRVLLSVGDVTGRGLEAAVIMANIRQVLRGIAHMHADPALMLEAADRALRAEHPNTYVTSFTCVFDAIEGTLSFATAGHPPALLRKASGEVLLLGTPGLPLGLRSKDEPDTETVSVDDGDVLVLYTDGVTEVARRPSDGEASLVALVAQGDIFQASNPPLEIYERIVGRSAPDDVAILVAQIGGYDTAAASPDTLARWSADAKDPAQVTQVKRELLEAVGRVTRNPEARFRAEVVFGELVGNVLRHTPGSIDVLLERHENALVLHVLDEGSGVTFTPALPSDDYSERGRGLFLAAQYSQEFAVTRRERGGSHARAVL